MPPAARRLIAAAAGAWAGAAGCTLLAPRWAASVGLAAGAAAVVVGRRGGIVAAAAAGLAAAAFAAAWHVHGLRRGPVSSLAARHAQVDVVARLVRDPQPIVTALGTRMTVVDATVTSVAVGGWRATNSPILVLSFGSGWDGLLPGQRVALTGRLAPPRRGDDVAAVLDARAPPVLLGRPPWWQVAAGRVRAALQRACRGLPADARGLVPGLVDGDVSAEPADLRDDMRLTGLTHLQAVSGENVAIVLAVVLAVARSAGLRRRGRVALAALVLVGFVILARPSPSVLRAAVMGALVLLATATGRRAATLPTLAAAVLVLVCLDPFLARAVGFVLSVLATGGILLLARPWTRRLARRLPRPLAVAIAVPAAAQLVCTPVLVLVFGRLTPYAVPANLLAAPAVAPATVLGVATAVVATASSTVATPFAWLAALPALVVATVARGFAVLPGAGLRWPGGLPLDLGCALAALAGGWRWRRRRATP